MITAELKAPKWFQNTSVGRASVKAAEKENYEKRRVLADEIEARTIADSAVANDFFAKIESADAAIREAQAELDLAIAHKRQLNYERTGHDLESNHYLANRRTLLAALAPHEIHELDVQLSRIQYRQITGELDEMVASRNETIRAAMQRLGAMKFEAAPHDDVRAELLEIRQSIPNFDALLLLTNYQPKE